MMYETGFQNTKSSVGFQSIAQKNWISNGPFKKIGEKSIEIRQ